MNSYNEVRQALDPVVGVPFRELAPALGIDLPADATRRKQAGGDVVEKVLQIAKNSIPKPDLEYLGTEVKTIPLNTRSRPREWTKISAFNIASVVAEADFRRSSVFAKLRSILFVPVMKTNNDAPDFWYLRPSFLWLPTESQLVRDPSDKANDQGIPHHESAASIGHALCPSGFKPVQTLELDGHQPTKPSVLRPHDMLEARGRRSTLSRQDRSRSDVRTIGEC